MGELGVAGGVAGADRGGMVFAGAGLLHDFLGQIRQVRHFVAENGGGARPNETAVRFAGLAGVRGAGDDVEVGPGQLGGNLGFLLVQGERRDRGGEIFDGEKHVAGLHDGDADGVKFRVEEIGAMRSGVHPLRVQAGCGMGLAPRFRRWC